MILIGVAGGLAVGWMMQPHNASTTFEKLAPEYQTDAVLMIAEIFRSEGDSSLAAYRLSTLSSSPPLRTVQEAILHAGDLGYTAADLDALARLAEVLSAPATATPITPRGTP